MTVLCWFAASSNACVTGSRSSMLMLRVMGVPAVPSVNESEVVWNANSGLFPSRILNTARSGEARTGPPVGLRNQRFTVSVPSTVESW